MVHSLRRRGKVFPRDRILLGGDHLGPNRWKSGPRRLRHERGRNPHGRLCRRRLREDPSRRELRVRLLHGAALSTRSSPPLRAIGQGVRGARRLATPPVYIIGTEVPTPGGAVRGGGPARTPPRWNYAELHPGRSSKAPSSTTGFKDAWSRIVGLVVQPGVEFLGDVIWLRIFPATRVSATSPWAITAWSFEAHFDLNVHQLPANFSGAWSQNDFNIPQRSDRGLLLLLVRESLLALEASRVRT